MLKAPLRQDAIAAIAGILLCAVFVSLVSVTPNPNARATTAMVFLLLFGLVAASTAIRRVASTRARRRNAWLSLSVGLGIAVLVNTVSLLIAVGVLHPGWAVIVNPLLVVGEIVGIISLVLFPRAQPRGIELVRLILDGLVVGGSGLLIASTAVFPTLLAAGQAHMSLLDQSQILALPVLDLVIATVATLLIARIRRSSRTPMRLIAIGFILFCISDMAYAVDVSLGGYGLGTWWNLGWLAGYLLLTMAALNPLVGTASTQHSPRTPFVFGTIVFFTIFLAAAATTIARAATTGLTTPVRSIWSALLLTVAIRQIVLAVDNERLRCSLEQRVEQRTKQVREVTHQRALLLSAVADGIYGVDRAGHITMANDATTQLLGRSASELIGSNAHEAFHAPQQNRELHPVDGCYITHAITTGLTISGKDDRYLRADGTTIEVEATTSPVRDDNGTINGAVVVFRDVSQRREMDRMKREFISMVSHELRTPLTSIRGALGLIAGGALGDAPPSMAKMIDIATAGSIRLGLLVNDILDIDRLDRGNLPLTIRPCDAAAACQEAINATTGLAQTARIQLRVGEVSGQVLADRDRLVQVLINLIGNAVRFSNPGDSVDVQASQETQFIRFAITDTGRGIPPDKLEQIFDRFNQVDSSDSREREGTGLGLAICRSLIATMGGRIWAESTLGQGSAFRFELPAATHEPCPPSSNV